MRDEDKSTATIHEATAADAARWHGGAGFYWVDDEYPEDSGAVGPFVSFAEAKAHVESGGYIAVAAKKAA